MRNLARNDARTGEVRTIAAALPNPWALEAWLRAVWTVTPDPEDAEYVRSPSFVVRCGRMEGDCDDAATFAASILRAMNYPALLVAVRMPHDTEFSHVFTRVPGISGYEPNALDIDPIVPPEHMPIRYSEAMVMPV